MRNAVLAVLAASLCAVAIANPVVANAAAASPRPSAAFTFKHNKVERDVKPVLTYRTTHLPRPSFAYLQRQYGSTRVWKNVERLKKAAGTVTAPGVQMGKYEYRIWVGKSGRTVVTSGVQRLY
jgi:hypothetical protein